MGFGYDDENYEDYAMRKHQSYMDKGAQMRNDVTAKVAERESGRQLLFSSRRRHTRFDCDWSSDVCSSDLEAMVMMSSAGAPRPWRRISAARAEASGSPASTMRCPWAMLNAFLVCRQAESSPIRTHVSFTGVRGRWRSWAPSCRGWRRRESESSPPTL